MGRETAAAEHSEQKSVQKWESSEPLNLLKENYHQESQFQELFCLVCSYDIGN